MLDEVDAVAVLETVDSYAIPVFKEYPVEDKILAAVGRVHHENGLSVPFSLINDPIVDCLVLGRNIHDEPVDVAGRAHGHLIAGPEDLDLFVDLYANAALNDPETLGLM